MTRNTTKTEVYEALEVLIRAGKVEAVCPRCNGVMDNHRPGRVSLCGTYGVSPKEVTYRAKKENTSK